LRRDKKRILNQILKSQNQIKSYSDSEKLNFFISNIYELSVFKDKDVIEVLNKLGIGGGVSNYFVDINELFEKLDKYFEKSIYRLPYTFILDFYEAYSKAFFVKQLAVELGLDLTKELDKLRRQEKDSCVDESILNDFDKLKEINDLVDEDNLDLRILIPGRYKSSSFRKIYNKPHKIILYNLLITLRDCSMASPIIKKDLNKFYTSFYDLMEIFSRDTYYLWDDTEKRDVRSGYSSVNNFKAKRVKSLLKLEGYGTY
jgi:hypothetical protein